MHPALVILTVVFTVHTTNLVGRERIQSALLPIYLRIFHSSDLKIQNALKKSLFETRQQLNKTSSQDEFAKWAKLRRSVDKSIAQLEVTNSRLSSASSTLSILLRIFLFLTTTLFPFLLTFYFGKTPMFFLPPSGTSSANSATRSQRLAPGGFVIPNNPNHAWDMVNETYLGPVGWVLSLTAAPRGSVSAGMWSTICTRVALLITDRIRESFIAISTVAEASRSPKPTFTTSSTSTSSDKKTSAEKTSEKIPPASASPNPANLRKRTAATTVGN